MQVADSGCPSWLRQEKAAHYCEWPSGHPRQAGLMLQEETSSGWDRDLGEGTECRWRHSGCLGGGERASGLDAICLDRGVLPKDTLCPTEGERGRKDTPSSVEQVKIKPPGASKDGPQLERGTLGATASPKCPAGPSGHSHVPDPSLMATKTKSGTAELQQQEEF